MASALPDLEQYRLDAEAFLVDLTRAEYRHGAGLTDRLPLEEIHERYSGVFDPALATALVEARADARGDRGRSLRNLALFSVDGAIQAATRSQEQAAVESESGAEVELAGGASVPYRALAGLVANEADRDRRVDLERRGMRTLDQVLNPVYAELWEARHGAARAIGGATYRSLYEDLRGLDLTALGERAEAFLAATQGTYERTVDAALRTLAGVGLADAAASDLPRLRRADALDERFPERDLVGILEHTLDGMGLPLDRQPNVRLDVEPRPTKSPRAFCAPARVPGEVYLVISPTGGLMDYSALFHEAGHAEHFGCTSATLPFEFRCIGDDAVTETYAFLFEGLLSDPAWLAQTIGGRDHQDVIRHVETVRLYMLRRYCAKLRYELQIHERGIEGMDGRYGDLLSEALLVPWPRERFLTDIDEGFYVVCYLRAWALELGLRGLLRERFGTRWFRERKAGRFLRELFEDGQRLTAEELAAELDLPPLDLERLAEDAVTVLA